MELWFQSLFFWIPAGKPVSGAITSVRPLVSILVLLDTGRKAFQVCICQVCFKVSILVLLDTGRKDLACDISAPRTSGFNPCSSGYRPERAQDASHAPIPTSFNPCSSGYRPERFISFAPSKFVREFQSLFFWIPAGKRLSGLCLSNPLPSFNPCSSGYRPERWGVIRHAQTLYGFNPCSSGYRPESVSSF